MNQYEQLVDSYRHYFNPGNKNFGKQYRHQHTSTAVQLVRLIVPAVPSALMEKYYFPDTPNVNNAIVQDVRVFIETIDTSEPTFQPGEIENWVVSLCSAQDDQFITQMPVKRLCPDALNPAYIASPNAFNGKLLPFDIKIDLRASFVQNTSTGFFVAPKAFIFAFYLK